MQSLWSRRATRGAAVVLATALSACSSAFSSSPLRIVTSDSSTPSGAEALLRGTLTADDDGCIQATTAGGPVTLVWPKGYTVRGDARSFEVLDAGKNIVASSGASLAIGGGGADSFPDTWTEPDCATGPFWLAGDAVSTD